MFLCLTNQRPHNIMYSNDEWGTRTQRIIDESPPSPTWANDEPFLFIERSKPGHTDLLSARAIYMYEYGEADEQMGLVKTNVLEELLFGFTFSCDTCRETLSELEQITCESCESVWCNDCLDYYDGPKEDRNEIFSCPDCEECLGCVEASWDDREHRNSNNGQYNITCHMVNILNR